GLLLDLAASEQFSTMVLLSPPPLSLSEIHASRVLIATGSLDIPRILAFAPIAADIANPTVEWWVLRWSGHAGPIFNPAYIRRTVEWLGGDSAKIRTGARIFWLAAMFVAAVLFGVALMPSRDLEPLDTPTTGILARYVIACSISLAVLKFVNPMAWLRFFAM